MGKGRKRSSKKDRSIRLGPPETQVVEDRISELPDEILVCILSLLTIKEAARTSVLSGRWINLWKYTSRLDFDATESLYAIGTEHTREKERSKYVHFVNHVMNLLQEGSRDEFRLRFDLDISNQDEISRWLEYASKRKIQRLELNFLSNGLFLDCPSRFCDFPDHLLNLNDDGLSNEEQPQMNYTAKRVPKLIAFRSLRALMLKNVNVTDEVFDYFLHNCPFLERLVVVGSSKLVNVRVSGSSLRLKRLKIKWCRNLKSIRICDCGLVSLGICELENLVLTNVPMLAEVSVHWLSTGFLHILFSQLSSSLSQLELLKLKGHGVKNITDFQEFPQLTQLKKLVIYTDSLVKDFSLMGLTSLLKSCPYLHKFVWELCWNKPLKIIKENENGAKSALKHLREFELAGYYGHTSDVELLMYFVENAVALEKIIIHPRCHLLSSHNSKVHRSKVALKQLKPLVPKHIELVILP